MRTFKSAISDHVRLLKKREAAEHARKVAEKKAEAAAIAKRRAPFQAAAATLEALMKEDPDFKKFLKERVAIIKRNNSAMYRAIASTTDREIASTTFGHHSVQDGWRFEMTPTYKQVNTEWYLTVDVSGKGRVEFKIYDNDSDHSYSSDPADVPDQVNTAFRPVLEILQKDRKTVYDLLLKKFGT